MIKIGTCSWTEKTLLQSGEFYPEETRTAEQRLRFYAEHFDTVEVDSSYYAMPSARTAALWAARTPDDFTFHIKAFGALTGHGITPRALPKEIRLLLPEKERNKHPLYIKEAAIIKAIADHFIGALDPLKNSGKLGLLVFQYPQWFHFRHSSFDFIMKCLELMKGLPMAVEFRHGSWLSDRNAPAVFNFLIKNRITYVIADEPQYGSQATVPFVPNATSDSVYFRFHGRNKTNWLRKGIETSLRYSYNYSKKELEEFADTILKLSKKVDKTYGMLNNCHGGFAIKNAINLKSMLSNSHI